MESSPLQENPQHSQGEDTKGSKQKRKHHKKRMGDDAVVSGPDEADRSHGLTGEKRRKPKSSKRKHRDDPAGAVSSVTPSSAVEAPQDTEDQKGKTTGPLPQEEQSPLPQAEQPQQAITPTQQDQPLEDQEASKQPDSAKPEEPRKPQHGGKQQPAGDISIRPSAIVILAACLLMLFSVSVSIMVFKLFRHTVDKSCVHPACREMTDVINMTPVQLLGYMEAIVDENVKPCNDFYRHVCGHWLQRETTQGPTAQTIPRAPSGTSFMADVLQNYTARRHRDMMARHAWVEPADTVSRYYQYCVAYKNVSRTLQETLDSLFKVTGINPESWKSLSSEAVLANLIRLSYLYRLHGLFRVTTSKDEHGTHFIIDRWTSFKRRLPNVSSDSQEQAFLESVLKTIAGRNVKDNAIKQCLDLDDSIGLREARNHSSLPVSLSANDCTNFPPPKWVTLVNALDQAPKLPADVSVTGRNFKDACGDIKSVLLHNEPVVRALYPLALVAVDILKLEYMLASGLKLESKLVQRFCHQDTIAVFKRLWLPALTNILSITTETVSTVDLYFSVFKTALERRIADDMGWMSKDDRQSTVSRSKELQISSLSNMTLSKQEVDNSRFNPSFGMSENDWIFNRVTVVKRLKVADDVDHDEDAVRDDDEYVNTVEVKLDADPAPGKIVVPHMFAVPPVFFDDVSGASYGNVALLGVQITRKALGLLVGTAVAGSWWSNETATAYGTLQKCYANKSNTFHAPLETEQQFDEAVAAALAIKLAYRYTPLIGEASADDVRFSSVQLFFKRACLSLCAGFKPAQDFNSVDRDVASAACTLAASSMPDFHTAFGCRDGDPMAAPKQCNF